MTKPASTIKKPRKQHTPEFRQEALKLAESGVVFVDSLDLLSARSRHGYARAATTELDVVRKFIFVLQRMKKRNLRKVIVMVLIKMILRHLIRGMNHYLTK